MTGGAAATARRTRAELEDEVARRQDLFYADKQLLREGRLEELLTGIRDRHRSSLRWMWIALAYYPFVLLNAASVAWAPPSEGAGVFWKWMATAVSVAWLVILAGMIFLIRYVRRDMRRTDALLAELVADRARP